MRALLWSVAILAAVSIPVRADDEVNKVIEKAIKAHGGSEVLSKYKDKSIIQKGKMKIAIMDGLEGTVEAYTVPSGKKFKQDINLTIMGMDINQVVGFDGKEMWIAINGKVFMTLDKKEDIELIEEAAFAEQAAALVLLKDKSIETSIIGESKIDDKPVIGIRVSRKGRKDVSLFFDKETGLLKKVQHRGLEFQSRTEVEQERVFDEYKEVDGQKRPSRVTVFQDGKKVVEIELTETKLVDSLDDSTFAKPKE